MMGNVPITLFWIFQLSYNSFKKDKVTQNHVQLMPEELNVPCCGRGGLSQGKIRSQSFNVQILGYVPKVWIWVSVEGKFFRPGRKSEIRQCHVVWSPLAPRLGLAVGTY